ncbi:hypothetical protein KGF56_002951 [Candida oxycetoniae]|uniref:Phosphatidylglycerophosphatase GEP4, mitochondrial n=1 Tax=Candida oxycetoniae TaxID=497107 RepID=A0AAI9SX62_9ASCO|nr:uncharacterized protein KGF56_002951 [Candida oxycetoniae]KAI3404190.2 hypothetical protein KGF56_002951 [Candida oxycetoniae]
MPQIFNLSATLNASRILYNPAICLPHFTVKSFDQLTIPLQIPNYPNVRIKGIVLDKDNCFAKDHDDKVWPDNSAGTDDDIDSKQAQILECKTGVNVLRHSVKKPGCIDEIKSYFAKLGIKPSEIVVIGDRLFTDMLMANMMGSWGCWISTGVELSNKVFPTLERGLYNKLVTNKPGNPWTPPTPPSS